MIDTKKREKLYNFGKRFLLISNKLSIGTNTLTPINYKEEKDKFFKSDSYNPHYHYHKNDTSGLHKDIQDLLQELDELTLPNTLKFHFQDAIEALSTDIDLIDTIGSDSFAEVAEDVFQYENINSNSFLAETAEIKFNEPDNCKLQSAEEMAESFQKHIDNMGIEYSVRLDDFNDHIIRVGSNRLIIGSKVRRFCNNVNRLIVHEIESHIFQRHNVKKTDNPLLQIITRPQTLLWGEGLAVYNEIQSGTITRSAYETYLYRLRAVEKLDYSFREIFNELATYLKPEKAFMITYRVKRGMGDTSNPGGYGKDASYLMGYKRVREYIQNKGRLDFLYLSKLPELGMLLQEYELLDDTPVLLPAYFTQKDSLVDAPPLVVKPEFPLHLQND